MVKGFQEMVVRECHKVFSCGELFSPNYNKNLLFPMYCTVKGIKVVTTYENACLYIIGAYPLQGTSMYQ